MPGRDPAFDRLLALAARVTGAPTAFLTFVDGDRQIVKGAHGAPSAFADVREAPLGECLCRHVVASGTTVAIAQARTDARSRDARVVRDLGVGAYAGAPVRSRDGRVLGALCVVDFAARHWRPDDVEALAALAHTVGAEIDLRCELAERERVAAHARALEAPHRDLLALSPSPMIIIDDEHFLAVNDAFVRLVGARDGAALVGRSAYETVGLDGENARLARERVREVLRTGVAAPLRRVEFRRLDGESVAVESTIVPTTLDGRPAALVAMRDRTEARRAREALRASEARFRHLVEAAHEGVCTTDVVGVVTYANPCLVEMLRTSVGEVVGRSLFDFMPPDAAFEARTLFARRQRGIAESHELTFRRADGAELHGIVSASALHDDAGEFAGMLALVTDVTERRRAEAALRESEASFRQLFERNPLPLWVLDAETLRFLDVNPAVEARYGWTREEFLRMTLRDVRPPEDVPALERNMRWLAEHGRMTVRVRHRTRDGSLRLVDVTMDSVVVHGRPAHLAVLDDVTERVAAEEARATSEARFRSLSELVPVGVFEVGAQGEATFMNPWIERLCQRPVGALLGHGWMRYIHDDDRARVVEGWHDARRHGRAFDCEYRTCRPDGTTRWIRVYAVPRAADGGAAEGHVGTIEDVTDRHEAQERLASSERYFRALIEHASELITLLAPDGRIAYANSAYSGILGYTPEEAVQLQAFDLVHPDDRAVVQERFAEVVASPGGTVRAEYRARHKDGSWRRLQSFARNMLHEPAIGGVIVNSRDVTGERALADQMRQAQKMEAIGRLAGGIAHDFNNLLTVINASTMFAREAVDADSPARDDLVAIDEAARRAGTLTRQLLAFSRQQVLRPRALDLSDAVADVSRMLERVIGADVRLETMLAPALPTVHADASQLEQVLMNLAVNARDAMPNGGTLRIETTLLRFDAAAAARYHGLTPGAYVALRVHDTGIGMDAATQARVFEPFFTTKEIGRGTGLGLSTVYGIVKQSGGYVYVDSAPGQGSAFTVLLPPSEAIAEAAEERGDATAAGGRETVLVVEDETPLRIVLARALRRAGYGVLEAGDGATALELVARERRPPDLVVSDAVMPGMRGAELLRLLRAQHPGLPALLISGYSPDTEALATVRGVELLGKPFSPQELLARVRAVLDGVASRGE